MGLQVLQRFIKELLSMGWRLATAGGANSRTRPTIARPAKKAAQLADDRERTACRIRGPAAVTVVSWSPCMVEIPFPG